MDNTVLVEKWRLVSYERHEADGSISYPYSSTPVGLLIYDNDGRMAVQVMAPNRPTLSLESDNEPATMKAVIDGYIAYFGKYEVDWDTGVVVHRVEGSLNPGGVGSDLKRTFQLDGTRLTLRNALRRVNGRDTSSILIWERIAN
jgi:hypothetical protein